MDLTGVLGATAACGDTGATAACGDTGMAVATIGTVPGIVVAPGRHGEKANCVGNAAGLMA